MLIAPFFEWFVDDREWLCYWLWGVDLAEVLRRKSRVLLHQQELLALAVLACWANHSGGEGTPTSDRWASCWKIWR